MVKERLTEKNKGSLLAAPILLPRMRPGRVWLSRLLILLGVCFAWPLLLWACAGAFSRLEADDYAVAASSRHLGLWASQWYWYNHWHGRFSMQFSLDALGLAAPGAAGALPPLFLVGWAAAAALTLRFGASLAGLSLPWLWASALSAAGIWSAIWITPQPQQATWWVSGLLTYLVPLAGMTLWPGLAAWATICRTEAALRRSGWMNLLGLGLLAFLIGGFSETATAVFALWLAAGALLLALRRSAALPVALAGFAGTMLAAAVMVHAPGNLIREAYCQPAPSFAFWWAKTWQAASFFTELRLWANENALVALAGIVVLTCLGLPALLPRRLAFVAILGSVAVPLLCFVSVITCFGLTFYAASSSLPPRAELLPSALVIFAVFSVAAVCGLILRMLVQVVSRSLEAAACYRVRAALVLAAALPAAYGAWSCWPDWSGAGQKAVVTMAAHARLCDQQTAFLRAATGHAVCLYDPPSSYAPSSLGGDPASWPNQAIAKFYGLPLVVGGSETRLLTPAEEARARQGSRIVPGLTPLVDGVPVRLRWLEDQQKRLREMPYLPLRCPTCL